MACRRGRSAVKAAVVFVIAFKRSGPRIVSTSCCESDRVDAVAYPGLSRDRRSSPGKLEHADVLRQKSDLGLQRFGRGGDLLDEGRVQLGDLVDLGDRDVHEVDARALFNGRRRDLRDDGDDQFDRLGDMGDRGRSKIDQVTSLVDPVHRLTDLHLDLPGGSRRALRQRAHLDGDDREPTSLCTGPRGFHRRVQRKDVGLGCNAIDDIL